MVKRGRGTPKKVAPPDHNLGPKMVKSDEELPEFFKVYLAEIYSEMVRIPPDFIKNFGGNVPETVTLKTKSGTSIGAEVNKIDDSWFLEKGWPEFVKENSVEEGDFLTFSYAGNSVFLVKIFAINGCIKGICDLTDDDEASDDQSEDSEDNGSNGRNPRATMPLRRNTKCGNRSFSIVMKDSWIRKGWMHIPSKFSTAYLNMDEGTKNGYSLGEEEVVESGNSDSK